MDRQIVYVGAVPLDTDQLLQSRNTMVALGYLAKMTIGDASVYVDGLGCTPGGGLTVTIGPGSMTLPTVIDAGYYGALPPDGDPVVKTGINTAPVVVSLPGTGTTVISGGVVEVQAGSSTLAYYNAANPGQTLFGAQGNGQAQASILQQRVAFAATAPSAVPAGYTALWQIVVPSSATAVDPSMITAAAGAPFVPVKLPQAAPILSPAFAGTPTAPTPSAGDASLALATTAFVAAATTRNRAAWGAAGTYSWTCPPGVSSVLARMWGAGGSGGSAGAGLPGGGGGGGGYEEVLIAVAAGTSYPIQVGGGTSGSTTTAFANLVQVSGGNNGTAGQTGQVGVGGSAGLPSTTSINFIGSFGVGPGQSGFQLGSTSVGGAGGPSFGVLGASACFGGTLGSNGLWPGGGGAGGASGAGGKGADGLMVIEWYG